MFRPIFCNAIRRTSCSRISKQIFLSPNLKNYTVTMHENQEQQQKQKQKQKQNQNRKQKQKQKQYKQQDKQNRINPVNRTKTINQDPRFVIPADEENTLGLFQLDHGVDAIEVGQYFEKYAPIDFAYTQIYKGSTRRTAKVQFKNAHDARLLFEQHQVKPFGLRKWKDKELQVTLKRPAFDLNYNNLIHPVEINYPPPPEFSRIDVFIHNLSPNTDEQDIRDLLSQYGEVVDVSHFRRLDGDSKHYAFARMKSKSDAQKIIDSSQIYPGLWCKYRRLVVGYKLEGFEAPKDEKLINAANFNNPYDTLLVNNLADQVTVESLTAYFNDLDPRLRIRHIMLDHDAENNKHAIVKFESRHDMEQVLNRHRDHSLDIPTEPGMILGVGLCIPQKFRAEQGDERFTLPPKNSKNLTFRNLGPEVDSISLSQELLKLLYPDFNITVISKVIVDPHNGYGEAHFRRKEAVKYILRRQRLLCDRIPQRENKNLEIDIKGANLALPPIYKKIDIPIDLQIRTRRVVIRRLHTPYTSPEDVRKLLEFYGVVEALQMANSNGIFLGYAFAVMHEQVQADALVYASRDDPGIWYQNRRLDIDYFQDSLNTRVYMPSVEKVSA